MNLTIRFPRLTDKDNFLKVVEYSRQLHQPWVQAPDTEKKFLDYLEKYQKENQISHLVMVDDAIAGVININEIVRGCFLSGYLGYYAMSGFAGKGHMTQALKAVIHKAFTEYGLHRLEANIQPENEASIALVRKCRFEKEGYSKDYLRINGKWRDHERWAVVRHV